MRGALVDPPPGAPASSLVRSCPETHAPDHPLPAGGARDPGGNNEEQSTTARRIDHDKEPTPWVLKSPERPAVVTRQKEEFAGVAVAWSGDRLPLPGALSRCRLPLCGTGDRHA